MVVNPLRSPLTAWVAPLPPRSVWRNMFVTRCEEFLCRDIDVPIFESIPIQPKKIKSILQAHAYAVWFSGRKVGQLAVTKVQEQLVKRSRFWSNTSVLVDLWDSSLKKTAIHPKHWVATNAARADWSRRSSRGLRTKISTKNNHLGMNKHEHASNLQSPPDWQCLHGDKRVWVATNCELR